MVADDGFGDALRRAVRLLQKREYCAGQLRGRLLEGYSAEVVSAVVAKLQRDGLLDDLRFAKMYVRGRDGWGAGYIRAALVEFGVGDGDVAVAMGEIADDEKSRALKVLKKKYPNRGRDVKTLASMARFLASRGFDEETINVVCGLGDVGD